MISELKISEFHKCIQLLDTPGHIEANAVVEGINPGRIFVDNRNAPTSGLIWLGNNDGFIFIGNEKNEEFNNELNDFIDSVIIPDANKLGFSWFEALSNHKGWNETIKKVLGYRNLTGWNQRVYMYKKENYHSNNEPTIENDYKMIKIDESLLKNNEHSIKNIEFLRSNILESWCSFDHFLRLGIGYCTTHQNEIVNVCFSNFVSQNVHSIAIETLKEHQGKKLAQKAGHTFVADCLKHNLVPYWDCMESNKPSIAIAEKIGFKVVKTYQGYYFSF